MLNLKIGKDFSIEGSSGDFTVVSYSLSCEGAHKGEYTPAYKNYFPKMSQALLFILNKKISESDKKSVKELIKVIREESKLIRKAVGEE